MKNAGKLKAGIYVEKSNWHDVSEERLWVAPLGDGTYSLESIPMYVQGLAFKDVVTVRKNENGNAEIGEVVRRSGHSTYRVLLLPGRFKVDFEKIWPEIEQLGCSYESNAGHEDVFAVDVPLAADIEAVYRLFEVGLEQKIWDFEEGFYFDR